MKLLKKQSGFTLIEMILVIVLIGITAAAAVPAFTGVQDANLDQQAERFIQDIKWAQKQSHFDLDLGQITLLLYADNYSIARNRQALEAYDGQRMLFKNLLDQTSIVISGANGADWEMYFFDEKGLPSDGQDINITINGTNNRSRTITIQGTTGFVSMQ